MEQGYNLCSVGGSLESRDRDGAEGQLVISRQSSRPL